MMVILRSYLSVLTPLILKLSFMLNMQPLFRKKKLLIPISMLLMLLIWMVMVLGGGCGC